MKGFADLCDSTAWSRKPRVNKPLVIVLAVLALGLGLCSLGIAPALASPKGPDQTAGPKASTGKMPVTLTFCYQGQITNPRLLVVDKSRQRLMFFRYLGEMVLEYEYPCATGESEGDKLKAGDERTPEGIYFTTHRYRDNKVTIFGDRALHLNYPNAFDRMEGREGNGIYIHGTNRALKPRSSNGCVVMRNADLAAISALVKENVTPVAVVSMLSWPNRERRVQACTLLDKIDLAALDKAPGKYESAVAITSQPPAETLVKTYARKLEALQTVLRDKVKVKTLGMALFGLGNQWVLIVDQELTGRKGEVQRVTRRFSACSAKISSVPRFCTITGWCRTGLLWTNWPLGRLI